MILETFSNLNDCMILFYDSTEALSGRLGSGYSGTALHKHPNPTAAPRTKHKRWLFDPSLPKQHVPLHPYLAGVPLVVSWAQAQLHVAGADARSCICCRLQDHAAQRHGRRELGEERPDLQLLQVCQHHHELLSRHRVVRLGVPEVTLAREDLT